MLQELAPNFFRLTVPLADSPLKSLNACLIKGKELCQNPYLSFRIDAILNNKRLSINDFLDDIMHENE